MICARCGREAERLPIGDTVLDENGRVVVREHRFCGMACALRWPCQCGPEQARLPL
jgi:hypothetical protein